MSIIYRKSMKGIDEVAFKSSGLPMRMSSYLLAVDGEHTVDQLVARNPQLPSLAIVLQGLFEQGFIEQVPADAARNVVDMQTMRVSNGSPVANIMQQMSAPAQAYQPPQQVYAAPVQYAPPPAAPAGYFPELETLKLQMARELTAILGADAAPVMNKIQSCKTKDDLFTTMMGIKKIITIYSGRVVADKFAAHYTVLST
jgi:hypothetical protein